MSQQPETKSQVMGQEEREGKSIAERRAFLTKSLASIGVVACSGAIASILNSCEEYTLRPAEQQDEGYEVDISAIDELQEIGGVAFVDVGVNNGGKPVVVLRLSQTECVTLTSVCTHDPCTPNPREYMLLPNNENPVDNIDDVLFCGCHESKFKVRNGEVVQGPAEIPLQVYPCSLNTATMVLSIQF